MRISRERSGPATPFTIPAALESPRKLSPPKLLRELVIKAAKDFQNEQRKTIAGLETQFKKEVTKAGMKANELTAEQKKPFVAATKVVYAKFEKDLGKEIMDIARKVQK